MASANDKSERLQSNEEVIEELTKDLESSCVREGGDQKEDGSSVTRSKDARLDGDSWDVLDKERNEDSDDNAQNTEPLEDVDEVLLKDRDLSLTESEQEVHLFFVHFCLGYIFCTTILYNYALQSVYFCRC